MNNGLPTRKPYLFGFENAWPDVAMEPSTSASPHTSAFSLDATHFGGRKARRGFGLQDWYTAYVLVGFAARLENWVAARIRGIQDMEALIWV